MTTQQIQKILKERPFKLTNHKNESFTFNFTEIHIFRDNIHVADYEIKERNGSHFISFLNTKNDIWSGDFKNILLVSNKITELLNYDSFELQKNGKINFTLIGL